MNGMTRIVKTVSQLMCGLIFIYGLYIIIHGHLTPGGGFAGGAIIAGAFILLILAYGSEMVNLKKEETQASIIESIALTIFIILAFSGLFYGTCVFFNNFLPKGEIGKLLSAGIIPAYNIVVGMEVAAALLTIFIGLVIYKEEILS